MFSIPKKRRGLVAALGLALLALLAFGAFAASAAQASPTWKRGGIPFGGKFPFEGESSTGGAFSIEIPSLGLDISCHEDVSGTIEAYDDVQFTSTLTGCSIAGFDKVCSLAEPISATFQGKVSEPLIAGGKHFAMEFEGEECPYIEIPISAPDLGFSLDFGEEEEDLSVTMSAEGYVRTGEGYVINGEGFNPEKATISSSSEWHLTGPEQGLGFGVS